MGILRLDIYFNLVRYNGYRQSGCLPHSQSSEYFIKKNVTLCSNRNVNVDKVLPLSDYLKYTEKILVH